MKSVVRCSLVLLLAGCGAATSEPSGSASSAALRVAVTTYPIEAIASAVGGDRVQVVSITGDAAAHDAEISPAMVAALADVDVVLYLGNDFQPEVSGLIDGLADDVATLDLLTSVQLQPVDANDPGSELDPHVWLDPENMATMTRAITQQLVSLDPDDAQGYQRRATEFSDQLTALSIEFESALARCRSTVVVTSHRAFGYLTSRYGLTQLPISGTSPGAEPSAAELQRVVDEARSQQVTTVFFERQDSSDLAQIVAQELGAATAGLDPLERLSARQRADGDDYFNVQRANRVALANGLGCAAR